MVFIFLSYFTLYNGLQFHPSHDSLLEPNLSFSLTHSAVLSLCLCTPTHPHTHTHTHTFMYLHNSLGFTKMPRQTISLTHTPCGSFLITSIKDIPNLRRLPHGCLPALPPIPLQRRCGISKVMEAAMWKPR